MSATRITWILHLSDPHLGPLAPGQTLTDEKVRLESQPDLETTQTVFKRTLARLKSYVDDHGPPDSVVVSGDLANEASDSGFTAFARLLAEYNEIWPDRSRIVVVPGNHDVVWREAPGTRPRYKGFLTATRDEGCATPLLDGVDFDTDTGALKRGVAAKPHLVQHDEFLVVPINSSNFCGAFVDLAGRWTRKQWEAELAPLGAGRAKVLEQLDYLRQHDMARVSLAQIEALGQLFDRLRIARPGDGRVRFAVIHHQLLPVSTREERKSFESLVNLGLIRQTLREYEVDVVLHGHKHYGAMFWDFLREEGEELTTPVRRVLVAASPGDFDVGRPVMRAFHLEGSTLARNLRVVNFEGAAPNSRKPAIANEVLAPIWITAMEAEQSERCFIRGTTSATTYARLRALFEQRGDAEMRNLVCQLEDPAGADRLPPAYPLPNEDDAEDWFRDLVDWWQLDWSELVHRRVLLFNHGERIYSRFGDQVDRASRILDQRSSSSRALIALVHPRETGRYEKDERDILRGTFPAFALAEFALVRRRGYRELDCFGYFRKHEMQYWWPINVAELARLQKKVRDGMGGRYKPRLGRIVTFSGIALWQETLPRVAVPEIDRLVDFPTRLVAMATAVVFPNQAGDQSRRDWNRVLDDLSGTRRSQPPRPRLGHLRLREEIGRLEALADSAETRAVSRRLDELGQIYEALHGPMVNAAGIEMIVHAVVRLRHAVSRALP